MRQIDKVNVKRLHYSLTAKGFSGMDMIRTTRLATMSAQLTQRAFQGMLK